VRADGSLLVERLPVRHSRSVVDEVLGSATGEADLRFSLDGAPVVVDTLVVTVEEGAGPVTWTRRANLAYHADDDGQVVLSDALSRDYMVELDDAGRVWVVFGDGVYGRRPPPGTANVRASYSVGGGAVGNVPAGAITVAKTTLPGLTSVTNLLPAAGGADAEPIERAVRFGPLAFRSGDRAVTLMDYRALTLQAGGVAKVHAQSTGWNRVDLYVAPEGSECVPSPPELKQRLVAYFEDRRMVGTSVRIMDPVCVPIDIAVEVVPENHHDPDAVRAQALAAVRAVIAFERVDFARPLYLSKVYEAVEALDGVRAATVTRFRRRDQAVPLPFRARRGILAEAGLGAIDALVIRAYEGAIAVEGRIDIGEVELPTPGTIVVDLRYEEA
jgi:predicted phage baseplate assembly protein